MADVVFGERVVVIGLGLLGLLAVQILKAAGCRVFGVDVDPGKVALALELGAHAGAPPSGGDLLRDVRAFSGGAGADAVIIFAATASNEPIEQAAELARERGRIVIPGLVGLDLPRKVSFEKELSYRVSRAWGPGLYDPNYEDRGLDYPLAHVRWTARRNLAHFLELLASRQVRVAPLITHRFPLADAVEVYARLLSGKERFTGVLLTYSEEPDLATTVALDPPAATGMAAASGRAGKVDPVSGARAEPAPGTAGAARDAHAGPRPAHVVRIGCVGAGMFARGTLLPALKAVGGYELRGLATSSGLSGRHVGRKYGFGFCTTRSSEILENPDIDLVMILTRHGSHARVASEALRAGKHVFVEKPLALSEEQLQDVIDAYRAGRTQLMVGFNRRFAPTTRAALRLFEPIRDPLVVTIRANTGFLPPESWVHDPQEGGGPIVGEACHFVDLAQALTRSLPVRVHAEAIPQGGPGALPASNVAVTLSMANGSVATVIYTTGGDKAFSRERVEAFGGGAACVIDNFRTMTFSRAGRATTSGHILSAVDRGYKVEMRAMLDSLRRGEPFPVRFEEYVATTRATFAALESLRTGQPVDLPAAA
jgi:predicted dehydrogenase